MTDNIPSNIPHWRGDVPTACDVCGDSILEIFVDCKTKMGPWGCLCVDCHTQHGFGFGVGRGQKYQKIECVPPPCRWVKIEG